MSTYNSKFSGAEIDALLEKVASGQVGGGGGSAWVVAGTSTSVDTDGATGISGLNDRNTEYLCTIQANVGQPWVFNISLIRGGIDSNVRNGSVLFLGMMDISWMNVDAIIDADGGLLYTRFYSGDNEITSSLAPYITEITVYKRPLMS